MAQKVQVIELQVGDQSLTFTVTRDTYSKFQNMASKDVFNAQHNFLVNSVKDEDREFLMACMENPANVTELCTSVLGEYKPDIAVVVKKRTITQG